MAMSVVIDDQVEIPMDLGGLADFRRWALSDEFPERGRIDYVAGRIEVDMSPEEFFCHGILKVEIVRVLSERVKRLGMGFLFTDRTRISSPDGDLSVEPDVVFISHETLATGRVRLIAKAGGVPGRYVELEGGPDLVVEIVSDSSVTKGTRRLPDAYFRAGVREFWLADARREELLFRIHARGPSGYEAVLADVEGFQPSAVFGCGFRLTSQHDADDRWSYDLLAREAKSV